MNGPVLPGEVVRLARPWVLGQRIDGGGFGQVYEATSADDVAAVKFVPKAPGADRELLFVDLHDVRYVVPVLDSGEHGDFLVLVMPRAEMSLRQVLDDREPFTVVEALPVLTDLADSLVDLSAQGIVHRDIKPQNVLELDGHWCLADFGISRYAEATTAVDTQKYAMSPPYAAPERWRAERATAAADVYALGVMAFEMLAGFLPFQGPTVEDFREQHLHASTPTLYGVAPGLAALVDECLYKAPEARPGAANLRARLEGLAGQQPQSSGLASLQAANRGEVSRRSEEARRGSEVRSEAERRASLLDAGLRSFARVSETLRSAIEAAASAATVTKLAGSAWTATLAGATLKIDEPVRVGDPHWVGPHGPQLFDVIAASSISLAVPPSSIGYRGRSHSLWYCDARESGRYSLYETAFMVTPMVGDPTAEAPFHLGPGQPAARALGPGLMEHQVAWPFTELVVGELDDFVDRWAGWFAAGASGTLGYPSPLPDRPTAGTWRTS